MHTSMLFQCAGNSSAPEQRLRKVATGLLFTAIAVTVNASIADYYLETLQTFYYRLYVSLGQEQADIRYQAEGRDLLQLPLY